MTIKNSSTENQIIFKKNETESTSIDESCSFWKYNNLFSDSYSLENSSRFPDEEFSFIKDDMDIPDPDFFINNTNKIPVIGISSLLLSDLDNICYPNHPNIGDNIGDNIVIEIQTSKKRGRTSADTNQNKKSPHDKFSSDNVLRKIKVNFLTFIIVFVNEILNYLGYEQQFSHLEYDFKQKITKKDMELLKEKTIGDIIKTKISGKYSDEKITNEEIYDQIKNDEVLKKLFSENSLQLFKKIYYKSKRKINLEEYGIKEEIFLSKNVKMYKDLLKGEEAEYQTAIIKSTLKNFYPGAIFLCN